MAGVLRRSSATLAVTTRSSHTKLAVATRALPTLRARTLSTTAPAGDSGDDAKQQRLGVTTRHPGGVPDFIHKWGPGPFRATGYALAASTLGAFGLSYLNELSHVVPVVVGALTAGYWTVGLNDMQQRHQALRRNFPVLIHVRYLLESVRPEIQQYLIESDTEAAPYSREMRTLIYQRSKGLPDTTALGTKRNVYAEGHEWAAHSMFPLHLEVGSGVERVTVGGSACTQPYSASIFNISAMSYGALSGNAVSALNKGAALAGCYHNTGEGGIAKFHKLGGDIVWNVGTGYFACGKSLPDGTRAFDPDLFAKNAALDCVKMIEIKMSQGAKPGHGGLLTAAKITPVIAEARGLGPPPYVDCNSPPSHSAFKSPMGCLRFVATLRELSGGKPIGLKLCVGQPKEVAALVHAMAESGITPDFITVDGAEGGTGAAPLEFQNSVGFPLAEGLRLVDSLLVGAGVRDEIKLIASGKVYNGFSLVRTLAYGADITNAARAYMFSLGCIQALQCNSNKCPTGITTQDPALESGLDVDTKAERVANLHGSTVKAALEIVGALGLTDPREVKPSHIFKRQSGVHTRSFDQLHENSFPVLTRPGVLIEDPEAVPKQLRDWWIQGGELHRATSHL